MAWTRYHGSSMHPPSIPARSRTKSGADDALPPPWVLLDDRAYLAGESNHTTAVSRTRHGDQIQATFFLADPPLDPLTEANLVLLVLVPGDPRNAIEPRKNDFYVYEVDDGGPPKATLTLLPHPLPDLFPFPWDRCYYLHDRQVGSRNEWLDREGMGACALIYIFLVPALCTRLTFPETLGLYTYISDTEVWSSKPASFPDGKLPRAAIRCDKVITIGGEAGTMAWVDLMRGIILCDVLPLDDDAKTLRYIPLPDPIRPDDTIDESGGMYRDVALVGSRIKYAEVQMHVRPGSAGPKGSFTIDGWTAVLWSRPANSFKEPTAWRKDHEVRAHEVSFVHGENNTVPGFELLPAVLDHQGNPQPTLVGIHVNRWYRKAWVIAVDMKNKRLRGVAEFGRAPRCASFHHAYRQSRIWEHLNVSQGTKSHLKRPGMPLPHGSSHKKPEISPHHVMHHCPSGQNPRATWPTFLGQTTDDDDYDDDERTRMADDMDLE
ncbi:hypothetical protein VPH35_108781 [Triticum aestivum]